MYLSPPLDINMRKTYQTHQIPTRRFFFANHKPFGLAKSGDELENDRAAYRVAADLPPFETKAAAGAIRESMAIFMLVVCCLK